VLRLKRIVISVLVATLVALWAFPLANQSSPVSGTAQADPGFCGVRNSTAPAPGTGILYVVRNKCNSTIQIRIWLTSFDRWGKAGCKPIAAHGFGYFADLAVDQNWDPRAC